MSIEEWSVLLPLGKLFAHGMCLLHATVADAQALRGDQAPLVTANRTELEYLQKILTSRVYDVCTETPLQRAALLSKSLGCNIYLKREDLQPIFSFKLRGAYNKIASLTEEQRQNGIVACSAGNHAQGVAMAAAKLGIDAVIVMPVATPMIKVCWRTFFFLVLKHSA